jgi:hypothetical protein
VLPLIQRFLHFASSDATVLHFDGDRLTSTGDTISRAKLSDIQDVLRESNCGPASIRLRKNGRAVFSASINVALHQRLRNLLFS